MPQKHCKTRPSKQCGFCNYLLDQSLISQDCQSGLIGESGRGCAGCLNYPCGPLEKAERAVLRYFLRHDNEAELARALCILFMPFKNEVAEIHDKDPTDVLAEHGEVINANRSNMKATIWSAR